LPMPSCRSFLCVLASTAAPPTTTHSTPSITGTYMHCDKEGATCKTDSCTVSKSFYLCHRSSCSSQSAAAPKSTIKPQGSSLLLQHAQTKKELSCGHSQQRQEERCSTTQVCVGLEGPSICASHLQHGAL
jgi:hypothetical protein